MAGTINGWTQATAAKHGAAVTSLARRMTSGTTTAAADLRVVWMGEHLALVSWPFGSKRVVVIKEVRNESDATLAAFRRLLPDLRGKLPERLTGRALDEVIAKLSRADEVWSAVVAEEKARLDAEETAKVEAAERASATRVAEREAAAYAHDAILALRDDPYIGAILSACTPLSAKAITDAIAASRTVDQARAAVQAGAPTFDPKRGECARAGEPCTFSGGGRCTRCGSYK